MALQWRQAVLIHTGRASDLAIEQTGNFRNNAERLKFRDA